MICGIDLGTTYSLIGHGDDLFTGLVSSNVDADTKHEVPRDYVSKSVISSYKIDMTTGDTGKVSIACSAIVLRELVDRAIKKTNSNIDTVVISVPAKFSSSQREAVYIAAEKANLNVECLINEPTAAAMYVCRDRKDLIVVYDLGGGTFDVTILDARTGQYYVVATDGFGHLAGDNFDNRILDDLLKTCNVKFRYRSAENMKYLLREVQRAKEAIQKNGLTKTIDLSIIGLNEKYDLTLDNYIKFEREVFAPTIEMTKSLVQVNLSPTDNPKLVFVGGSTACPYLREWVEKETGLESIDYNMQPDYTVAKGVALYAKMCEDGTAEREVVDVTRRLCIEDNNGMAIVVIDENTAIPVTEELTLSNSDETDTLRIKLYQGNNILCEDNEYVGTLEYKYNEIKKPDKGVVLIDVTVNRNGIITLEGTDIETMQTQKIKLVMR